MSHSRVPLELALGAEEVMRKALLERTQTAFHSYGTTRLTKNIEQGAADPLLKGDGVSNLRSFWVAGFLELYVYGL